MPNRVVREGILDSDRVNKLSWSAEVFYRRLMSVVDDFGRFDARVDVLRSKLFPLRIDKVSIADVEKWLTECVGAGLVSTYLVNQKPYLEILDFGQTVRIKKSKFPPPDMHMQANASICMPETKRNETESGIETESETESETADAGDKKKVFKEKKSEPEIELPWVSEKFKQVWSAWKEYRWREKRQKFKSSASELAQLKHLYTLANGNEGDAIAIIEQSIGNTWTGLFQLKSKIQNGNQKQPVIQSQPWRS